MSEARRALVLGGSGVVGGAVVRELAARGVTTTFTYHARAAEAEALAAATGASALAVDLREPSTLADRIRVLGDEAPHVLVHAAGLARATRIADLDALELESAHRIGTVSLVLAVQALAPRWIRRGGGALVAVSALAGGQTLPVPVALAATSGATSGLVTAIAKELGPHGVRANAVALGPLERGASEVLPERTRSDYLAFSALRRLGRPEEAARAIAWLALDDRAINGKTVPVQGGI